MSPPLPRGPTYQGGMVAVLVPIGHGICRPGRSTAGHRPLHDRCLPCRVRHLRAVVGSSSSGRLLGRPHDLRRHHAASRASRTSIVPTTGSAKSWSGAGGFPAVPLVTVLVERLKTTERGSPSCRRAYGTCRHLTSSPTLLGPGLVARGARATSVLNPVTIGVAEQNDGVRLEIYVRPGASRTAVGGEYDGRLVVRVVEPADHGRATVAAINAVADALKIARPAVTLVRGAASRRKLVEVHPGAPGERSIAELIASLRSPAN